MFSDGGGWGSLGGVILIKLLPGLWQLSPLKEKKEKKKKKKRKEKKTLSDYNCKMIVKLKVIHTYMYRVI